MHRIDPDRYLEQDFDQQFETRKERRDKLRYKKGHAPKGRNESVQYVADLVEHAGKAPVDVTQHFAPTYHGKLHEQFWILNYLEEFYHAQLITDVLGKGKGGKEANVYCCAAHPSTGMHLIAAKLYRPRMMRNLRNDARYRQGRDIRDESGKVTRRSREIRAITNNTRFGQVLRHISWLETEFQALKTLSAAGADVPQPLARGDNVILMEFAGEKGLPAPTLTETTLSRAEAKRVFGRMVENLEIMLAHHCVHADLSAYNVLYWDGEFKIIDFPQAVDPRRNPDASDLFTRDVTRICQYFQRYGLGNDPLALAGEMWERYALQAAVGEEAGESDS
jgi:RIO kinase 1